MTMKQKHLCAGSDTLVSADAPRQGVTGRRATCPGCGRSISIAPNRGTYRRHWCGAEPTKAKAMPRGAAARERARIVAWLRRRVLLRAAIREWGGSVEDDYADRIEKGEHLK